MRIEPDTSWSSISEDPEPKADVYSCAKPEAYDHPVFEDQIPF